MTCTCKVTPRDRVGQIHDRLGRLVYAFNMDCPDHGVVFSQPRPMKEVWRRAIMTLEQALIMRHRVDCIRLISREPGATVALMEWLDYEFDDTAV